MSDRQSVCRSTTCHHCSNCGHQQAHHKPGGACCFEIAEHGELFRADNTDLLEVVP